MSYAAAITDVIDTEPCGVIGPNAVIQLANALKVGAGAEIARQVFADAGHLELLEHMPAEMIDERVPAALFAALWRILPYETAQQIAEDAGRRTARYILQNRIPSLAQFVLCRLPASVARRLLLGAISKNAWTFAGSGICRARPGNPALIEIIGNPMAMPDCVWHQAVFGELFGSLVAGRVRIRHLQCCRTGGAVCRFELSFSRSHGI